MIWIVTFDDGDEAMVEATSEAEAIEFGQFCGEGFNPPIVVSARCRDAS